jgi:hypothetical protein
LGLAVIRLVRVKDKRMDEPEIGIGLQAGDGSRPKPGLALRLLEGVGLVGMMFGFAAWQPIWIVLGVAAIAGSYAIYRKRHGRRGSGGSSDSGGDDGIDGSGDGGGGD